MSRVRFFVDNFVPYIAGTTVGARNHPRLVEGELWVAWSEPSEHPGRTSGYDFMLLRDGRVFKRADCYTPSSPYGWDDVSDRHVEVIDTGPMGLDEIEE